MMPDRTHDHSLLTQEVLAEFSALPDALFDTAVLMFKDFLRSAQAAGMTSGEVAAVIAAPSFRAVLEDERRLNDMLLANALSQGFPPCRFSSSPSTTTPT